MKFKDAFYLPSGRVFLLETDDGYPIECTEMRDVSVGGKEHLEVRNTQDPHIIWNHLKPYEEKWLLTVSTQKGCTYNCQFCDVAALPFGGNLSANEIEEQIEFILDASPYVTKSNKVKIGFARMGEPMKNIKNVINAMISLKRISHYRKRDFKWLPCFNTIVPMRGWQDTNGLDLLEKIIFIKENEFWGYLHLQISCNSTDEGVRQTLFGGAKVVPLSIIVERINQLPITNRTITLNFIVMEGVPVDINYLMSLGLNPEKFTVKLIPLNNTLRAQDNELKTVANYANYEKLQQMEEEFKKHGIPTVIDAIAKCEEAGLCCGQLAHVFVKGEK